MKLQCPHCGVKGSADDSYSGRKVKCPKCLGLFELKPDMDLELGEEPALSSQLSSIDDELTTPLGEAELPAPADEGSSEVEAVEEDQVVAVEELEESLEIEEELTKSDELATTPSSEEEVLEWDDIASEIDLKVDEEGTGADQDEMQEDSPASSSSIQDELETPVGDVDISVEEERESVDESEKDTWAELEENPAESKDSEAIEKSTLLEAVDLEEPEEAIADDPANIEEKTETLEDFEEGASEDEVQLVQEGDEIELEPYGIDKEQCWQCGKADSIEESFVEQDGRLYCTDCAPIEDSGETVDSNQGQEAGDQDVTDDAASLYLPKISVGGAISEAWAKTKGAKGAIWAGSAIMYLVLLIIVAGGAYLLPPMDTDVTNVTIPDMVNNILFQAVTNSFYFLFIAGLLLMGIRKVAGDQISWKMVFKGFGCAGKIIIATLLQTLLVTIGFFLLVLPGIYLTVGYAMTLPLIIDKGMSPWQAMETSRRAVHKVWWKVAGLFLVMGLIFVVSIIPLGLGLIWTWPMFIILAGVVYHHLFSYEEEES